jgi:hypothetical protein
MWVDILTLVAAAAVIFALLSLLDWYDKRSRH